MKTFVEKALETNIASGTDERMVVDGVTINRIPLAEPVLWITYKDIMQRTRTLTEVAELAQKAKDMINSTGLSWEEYRRLPDRGPGYNGDTCIWRHFDASLSLFSNEFLHEDESVRGLWYYDFRFDYLVIAPRGASHMIVVKHFPTEAEYLYLKGMGYEHKSYPINHIEPEYIFFPNKEVANPDTREGIVTI